MTLLVEDDGIGFDGPTAPAGQGLSGMGDRVEALGGTLSTESVPGSGTRVDARLPVPVPSDHAGGR